MDRRSLVGAVAVVGLLAAVGVATAVMGVGAGAGVFGGDGDPPELRSFATDGPHCTDRFASNSSTTVRSGGPNVEITYARNVSLPASAATLGDPSLERRNETTHVLSIPFAETDDERACDGVVRYEADVRMPAGDAPWRLVVEHDGEHVTTIYGDSDGSGVGSSVSVGERVSEGDAHGNDSDGA